AGGEVGPEGLEERTRCCGDRLECRAQQRRARGGVPDEDPLRQELVGVDRSGGRRPRGGGSQAREGGLDRERGTLARTALGADDDGARPEPGHEAGRCGGEIVLPTEDDDDPIALDPYEAVLRG